MKRLIALFPLITLLAIGCVHTRPEGHDEALTLEQLNDRFAQKNATILREGGQEVKAFHVRVGADTTWWSEGGIHHQMPSQEVVSVTMRNHGRGFFEGMGVGLLLGAIGGGIVGFAGGDDECDQWCFYSKAEEKAGLFALFFGILGVPTGGIIGAATGSKERYLIGPSLPQPPQDQILSIPDPVSDAPRRE